MSDTRTPLCDAYAESISAVEIVKNPIREFADAIQFAKKLERKAAHFEAMREALRKLHAECRGILGMADQALRQELGNTNVNVLELRVVEASAALADADEIGGD